jgi:hypothetical protein
VIIVFTNIMLLIIIAVTIILSKGKALNMLRFDIGYKYDEDYISDWKLHELY